MGVPNTTTFDMDDVKVAVGNYDNLSDFFKFAVSAKFDPAYSGNKDNLLNFRNYGNLKYWQQINAYGSIYQATMGGAAADLNAHNIGSLP